MLSRLASEEARDLFTTEAFGVDANVNADVNNEPDGHKNANTDSQINHPSIPNIRVLCAQLVGVSW